MIKNLSILLFFTGAALSSHADLASGRITSVYLNDKILWIALTEFTASQGQPGLTSIVEYSIEKQQVLKSIPIKDLGSAHVLLMYPALEKNKYIVVSQDFVSPQTSATVALLDVETNQLSSMQSLECASMDQVTLSKDKISLTCENPRAPKLEKKIEKNLPAKVALKRRTRLALPQANATEGKVSAKIMGDWPDWEQVKVSSLKKPIGIKDLTKK